MGCNQSKINNEEAIAICRDRKLFIKDVITTRQAFAAAHYAYTITLNNIGAALGDFADGKNQMSQFTTTTSADNSSSSYIPEESPKKLSEIPLPLPPPPPPLPGFSPSPLQRAGAASLPEIKIAKPDPKPMPKPIIEDEDEERELENEGSLRKRRSDINTVVGGGSGSGSDGGVNSNRRLEDEDDAPPPLVKQPPENDDTMLNQQKNSAWEYFFPSMENNPGMSLNEEAEHIPENDEGMEETKRIVKHSSVNFLQIFTDLDDNFLKASKSGFEVSKMLEATTLYYPDVPDNRGHFDHSARIKRVITGNRLSRSLKGIPNMGDGKDDYDPDEYETHATILDKLLTWEKKLYYEVKAGKLMKFEYQRKVAKRGINSKALKKAKENVSHLPTRYNVDMQSLDSTVSEINRLRDEQLYPRLVQLVDEMATMWKTILLHHEKQSEIVTFLRSLHPSQFPRETSEHHHLRTYQLLAVVQQWHSQFEMLVNNQKVYIKALSNWLKFNLIPIESSLKENVSSPPRVIRPPIHVLILAWHDRLEKLPDELATTAIGNFAAVIDTIFNLQEKEIVYKRKLEETRKEFLSKTRQFEDWYHKYMQRKTQDEYDPDKAEDVNAPDEIVTEKHFLVEQLRKRFDNELETYDKQCLQVRQKTLGSLKNRMPDLFRAMCDFSLECSKMYTELCSVSQHLGQNLH